VRQCVWGVGKGIQRTWLAEAEKARFWNRLKERRAANIFDILSQTWMEKRRREGEEGEEEKGRRLGLGERFSTAASALPMPRPILPRFLGARHFRALRGFSLFTACASARFMMPLHWTLKLKFPKNAVADEKVNPPIPQQYRKPGQSQELYNSRAHRRKCNTAQQNRKKTITPPQNIHLSWRARRSTMRIVSPLTPNVLATL
jgi:hypothetical protein